MRHALTLLCAVLLVAAFVAPAAAQTPPSATNSKAVKSIASVLMDIQHFPNDAQKKTLTTVAADSATTAQEKVLIQAILGMMHSINDADKPKVEAIMKDASAPAGVKSIATILDHFLHMVNAEDKATLQKLAA
jgi:hypothetical protein